MIKAHIYVDDVLRFRGKLQHTPRNGDTLRIEGPKYAKVTEIIWCIDEEDLDSKGQRVNIRAVSETALGPDGTSAEKE
jgi:hypothetical protein